MNSANSVTRPRTYFSRLSSCLALSLPLWFGCNLSDQVNGTVDQQEKQIKQEACKQMLSHTDLIVGGVTALSAAVTPMAHCQQLPSSQCTICYTDSPPDQSLVLSTKGCAIDSPAEGKDYNLTMKLNDLSLSAHKESTGIVSLWGSGDLDLGATLPVIGDYKGTVSYDLHDSTISPASGEVSLKLRLSYKTGDTDLELKVVVQGTREHLTGTVTGPELACHVSGSLKAPVVSCP